MYAPPFLPTPTAGTVDMRLEGRYITSGAYGYQLSMTAPHGLHHGYRLNKNVKRVAGRQYSTYTNIKLLAFSVQYG